MHVCARVYKHVLAWRKREPVETGVGMCGSLAELDITRNLRERSAA